MRWLVLVTGGLLVAPAPLAVVLTPLLVLVFGSPADLEPAELAMNTAIAGPGLFLAAAIIAPMAVVALSIPAWLLLTIGGLFRRRTRVEACVRDRPIEPPARSTLEGRLRELRERLERLRGRVATGPAFAIGAASVAAVMVGLSFMAREEDFLPWAAAAVGFFGVVVVYFAGGLWFSSVLPALKWLVSGVGLVPKGAERGRHAFDDTREEVEMLERWTADRAEATGTADGPTRVVAPLSGEEVLAFRIRGRVGDWIIDDAGAVDGFSLHVDRGPVVRVHADDWVVPLAKGAPAWVEPTVELQAFLQRLGVPIEGEWILAEAVIRPGDRVTVHGDEDEELAPGQGYRDELSALLTGSSGAPVVLRSS